MSREWYVCVCVCVLFDVRNERHRTQEEEEEKEEDAQRTKKIYNRPGAWLRRRTRPLTFVFSVCVSYQFGSRWQGATKRINGWRERDCRRMNSVPSRTDDWTQMKRLKLAKWENKYRDVVVFAVNAIVAEPKFMNSTHIHTHKWRTNERALAGNGNLVKEKWPFFFVSIVLTTGCALHVTPINFGLYLILPRPLQ